MARPRVFADSPSRLRSHRSALARLDVSVPPRTKIAIDEIASSLGYPSAEVVRHLIRFALTNRNWKQVGLLGSGGVSEGRQ